MSRNMADIKLWFWNSNENIKREVAHENDFSKERVAKVESSGFGTLSSLDAGALWGYEVG